MNIDFEYTAQDIPKNNYLADIGLLVLENKVIEMPLVILRG